MRRPEHSDQIRGAIQKAATTADQKTGGRYTEKIEQAGTKADTFVGALKEPATPAEGDGEQAPAEWSSGGLGRAGLVGLQAPDHARLSAALSGRPVPESAADRRAARRRRRVAADGARAELRARAGLPRRRDLGVSRACQRQQPVPPTARVDVRDRHARWRGSRDRALSAFSRRARRAARHPSRRPLRAGRDRRLSTCMKPWT